MKMTAPQYTSVYVIFKVYMIDPCKLHQSEGNFGWIQMLSI